MKAGVKRLPRPHEDVSRGPEPPQDAVRTLGQPVTRLRELGNDDHEVVVAVGAGVAPGTRAEEINALGVQHLDEAADDLRENRVLSQVLGETHRE